MKHLVSLVVVSAVAAAAAGTATPASGPARHVTPVASTLRGCAPAKFRGVQHDNYVRNCQVCRVLGWRTIRREYHIASKNPVVIARRYAQKTYRPVYRLAVSEGCLRGFRLRGRP